MIKKKIKSLKKMKKKSFRKIQQQLKNKMIN